MPREGTDGWRAAAIGLFIALSDGTVDIPNGPVPMAKVVRDANKRMLRKHTHPHAIQRGTKGTILGGFYATMNKAKMSSFCATIIISLESYLSFEKQNNTLQTKN